MGVPVGHRSLQEPVTKLPFACVPWETKNNKQHIPSDEFLLKPAGGVGVSM